jgi:serine-type D-Ala-D-Ala carboxypeptidase/endopeptidase (penicillin-binding protein 4)
MLPNNKMMKVGNGNLLVSLLIVVISSCSVSKQVNRRATQILLQDSVISTGHIGISIYEPATNQYWYNFNATKYFVPASNTKLFSLYAGMKYLGDSLVGMRYTYSKISDTDKMLILVPAGDPTFLHPDFKKQAVYNFLKNDSGSYTSFCIDDTVWKDKPLGYGWAWDDYNDDYMVERSSFPMFGNTVSIKLKNREEIKNLYANVFIDPDNFNPFMVQPAYMEPLIRPGLGYLSYEYLKPIRDSSASKTGIKFEIKRRLETNEFSIVPSGATFTSTTIPLHLEKNNFFQRGFLENRFKKYSFYSTGHSKDSSEELLQILDSDARQRSIRLDQLKIIHSQPSDSLFTPMMHNSDNFFAEQTLLMVSNEKLGYMNDEAIIDTLLNNDLKDIPQRPEWVDGSGLSRYNLFTPQDFIYILNKMKNEFGLDRMKTILPTGGEGTIKNYYKTDSGFIYVKTGTLSNHVALSGYLITKKNRLLIFSLLANNVTGSATNVRRGFEKFLKDLRKKY